jgi:hypothetical protein
VVSLRSVLLYERSMFARQYTKNKKNENNRAPLVSQLIKSTEYLNFRHFSAF